MNIDKKLELAHEYAVANNSYSSDAWAYADAMEVEYNKRKQAEDEKNAKDAKVFFDKLINKNINAYMNCDIQVTDDDGKFRITTRQKEIDAKEFQVDWSVAPDDAMYWAMDEDTCCNWYGKEPEVIVVRNRWDFGNVLESAPSFGYQGDWKDSLRKRPK